MSSKSTTRYVDAFRKLNTSKSRSVWDVSTLYQAPHKPVLLLSVLDLIAEGSINLNLIELSPERGELFDIY